MNINFENESFIFFIRVYKRYFTWIGMFSNIFSMIKKYSVFGKKIRIKMGIFWKEDFKEWID